MRQELGISKKSRLSAQRHCATTAVTIGKLDETTDGDGWSESSKRRRAAVVGTSDNEDESVDGDDGRR